jgi:hypothetical protein
MKKTIRIAVALTFVAALGMAQDAPKGPVAKDAEEANLVNTAAKEADPAKRLQELEQWSQKYPDTQLTEQRELLYWVTYQQLKPPKAREAVDWAKSVLAKKPDDYMALMTILQFGPTLNNNNPPQEDFDATMAAANKMLDEPDKVFAESNRPQTVPAADWPKVKPYWMQQAPRIEAQMWVNKYGKTDPARAEQEIGKILQKDPNDAAIDQMMGSVILAQQKEHPEKGGLALFYYARAACYDGEGALPAANRNQLKSGFLTRAYTTYHGSSDGLDQLCQTAKANPAPPPDFKLMSVADIAEAKNKAEQEALKNNPAMVYWNTIKTGLTGDNADSFFANTVKDAALPGKNPNDQSDMKWTGKIVSMKPAISPKELVMAVQNPAGDVTLKLEEPLRGKMEPGSELRFSGTATGYQKDPYMLILSTDKDQIEGWKPEVIHTKKSGAASKKKAQ